MRAAPAQKVRQPQTKSAKEDEPKSAAQLGSPEFPNKKHAQRHHDYQGCDGLVVNSPTHMRANQSGDYAYTERKG